MTTENKKNLFDAGNILTFILSRWKPLLVITILAMAASVVISLVLPEKYKATVILFPGQNNNLSRAFLSMQADNTKDFLSFGGEENGSEQLMQVLRSDQLMYAIAKKYDLLHYYSLDDQWDKYYLLKGSYNELFNYSITEYESIEIKVFDRDPKMAAKLANGVAYLADSIIQQIIKQRSMAAYKVVKGQYDSAVAVANKLEDSLNFYHNLGILHWQNQVDELTAGYTDAEVNNNTQAAKDISDKLQIFEKYGKGFLVLNNELEATFEWLKQARESCMQAKVNAEQTIPSFFIADRAVPADRKTYPIRGLVVIGGTIISLFIAILVLLILNRFKMARKG